MTAMKRLLGCAVLLGSSLALAQIHVDIQVPVPTIQFEVRPPLVTVATGIQVVQDSDDEVFFMRGAYWCRRDGRWYRAKDDHHWKWKPVKEKGVPPGLWRIPPGRYRHFHGHPMRPVPAGFREHGHDHWEGHERDHGHWDDHDRDDHGHGHDHHDDHGHGHGHGH